MPTLDLDFLRTRPASPWLRWLLLAIALGFAADVGFAYYSVRTRMADNEHALARIRPAADGAADAAARRSPPSAEEVKIARETMQRLALPWDKLFRALEAAASDKVALLSVEPDARTGAVLISGEAAEYRSALEYVSLLGRGGALERPHLVRHEQLDNAGAKSVRFVVSAAWSTEP